LKPLPAGRPSSARTGPALNAFLSPGRETLIARNSRDVLRHLKNLPEAERARIGACARRRVLSSHTSLHRAMDLEHYVAQASGGAHVASLRPTVAARPA